VVSDIAAIRKAMDAAGHPALFMVDGVSSIGSMEFRMDDWGVDLAVTGSQKGFMLPAGLCIVGASPKAMAHMEGGGLPRCFFDFRDMQKGYAANAYPYTPVVGLLNGLKVAGDMIMEEGLDNVIARHAHMAAGVRAAVHGWGLSLCAESPECYSDTVSAIVVPDGFDASLVVNRAATVYCTAFGAGLGEVAGKVFRIGHLGMITEGMLLQGIATAEMAMVDLGLPVKLGSGVAAAQELYRAAMPAPLEMAAE
jgi:alanine-glyoxylate transaminase/serine-glyoxylate transaminase/serine-pyruvate transaminase